MALLDNGFKADETHSGKAESILAAIVDVTDAVLPRKALENSANAVENDRQNIRNLSKQTREMVCQLLISPTHQMDNQLRVNASADVVV